MGKNIKKKVKAPSKTAKYKNGYKPDTTTIRMFGGTKVSVKSEIVYPIFFNGVIFGVILAYVVTLIF